MQEVLGITREQSHKRLYFDNVQARTECLQRSATVSSIAEQDERQLEAMLEETEHVAEGLSASSSKSSTLFCSHDQNLQVV
ncbi:MAG: hypothetical protein MHM6MM_003916 [Cercozoa sp. M6MM]